MPVPFIATGGHERLQVGAEYGFIGDVPVMDVDPRQVARLSARHGVDVPMQVQMTRSGGVLTVQERFTLNGNVWYRVDVRETSGNETTTGWVNADALLSATITRVD